MELLGLDAAVVDVEEVERSYDIATKGKWRRMHFDKCDRNYHILLKAKHVIIF